MEEHRIAPERGNVISGAFAFVVTILITIILADLLRAVVRNVSLASLAVTGHDIALGVLTVAILLEALIAAFDNYAYTRERYDPLHRGIVKFEIARYLIIFFSVIVLFLGVTSVSNVWMGIGELSTTAKVVTAVIIIRYLTEVVWQSSAIFRSYYLTSRDPDTPTTFDGYDPYTDEAFRTLGLSERQGGVIGTLWHFNWISYPSLVMLAFIGQLLLEIAPWAPLDALIAGGVVFVTEYLYVKIWAEQYYRPLLNLEEPLVSDESIHKYDKKTDTDAEDYEPGDGDGGSDINAALRRVSSDDEEVSTERLAREIKFYHDDPRYEFQVGQGSDEVIEFLEMIRRDDVSPNELVEEFCTPASPDEVNSEESESITEP